MEEQLLIEQPSTLGQLPEPNLKSTPIQHALLPGGTAERDRPVQPLPKDLVQSIFDGAANTAKAKKDPYASKFQDADLTSRYDGYQVFAGDYKLDPKLLDARYSKQQSYLDQSVNSLKVGLANGGAMFASGMLGLPDLIRNIANGTPIDQSPLEKTLFDWSKGVSDNNVTFENEQDQKTDAWNTIKNVLLPSALSGSSKGWGSIFESAMYGVGAGASIAVQELAIGAIAPGVGNIASLGGVVAKTLNNINSIRKYSQFADRIFDTSAAIYKVSRDLNLGNKIATAGKWGYRSTMGAYGEAAFEAEEARHSLKTDLVDKFKQQNGYTPTGAELENIGKLADEGAKARFWGNMALLMGSNTFQFKRLFKNFDLAKETSENLARQGLKVGLNENGEAIAKKAFELKSDWWNKGFQKNLKPIVEKAGGSLNSDLLQESLSEGAEEFSQEWISNSVNNYYAWKLDHRGQDSLDKAVNSVAQGFSESWNTQGLKSFLSGAIAGVAQQAVFEGLGTAYTAATDPTKLNMSKQREEALNETLKEYNNFNLKDFAKGVNINSVRGSMSTRAQELNAHGVIDQVQELAVEANDKKLYKDMEALSFFNSAEAYVKKGHADILKQKFDFSIKDMTPEQMEDVFGFPITKEQASASFNSQVDKVNTSFSRIKQSFKNPYKVSDPAFMAFEEGFVPQLAYLDYRMDDLNQRKKDIQSDLGAYYDEFKYFADQNDVKRGRAYIESEIANLKESEPFKRSLERADPSFTEDFVKERFMVKKYEESLKDLDTFDSDSTLENYEAFLETYFDAFASKIEVDEKGFYNRDDVMQKLTDFNRITTDLTVADKMLKSYLSRDGQQIFLNSYIAYSQSEQRKREAFTLSEDFKGVKTKLKDAYSQLSEDQINSILNESSNEAEATSKAKSLAEKIDKENIETEEFKQKVRDKFITAGKGSEVEDYLNSIDPKKTTIDQVDAYLRTLDNQEFSDFKDKLREDHISEIQKIDPRFTEDNINEVYDTLSNEDKIKYHEAVINYRQEIKKYPKLPVAYKKKQDDIINDSKETIKELKKLPEEPPIVFEEPAIDVKFENINNLENKFENGYFDPNWFDSSGNKRTDAEFEIENLRAKLARAELFHSFENMTETEISKLINDNLVVDAFTTEDDKVTEQVKKINPGKSTTGELQEPVLRSVTTNAVVLSYDHQLYGKVQLNTVKSNDDLVFVPNLVDVLSKSHYNKRKDLVAIKFENPEPIAAKLVGRTYKQFLEESLIDSTTFDQLTAHGFVKFKGTAQEQLTLLKERQKTFDYLFNNSLDDIKANVSFVREFVATNNDERTTVHTDRVMHPFASLNLDGISYNKYVYFRIPNDFEFSPSANLNVEFIGLEDDFREDALEKIKRGLAKKTKGEKIGSGYYTMISDSTGNPFVYWMSNRKLTPADWYAGYTNNPDSVMVNTTNPFVSVSISPTNTSDIIVSVKNGDKTTSFNYELNSEVKARRLPEAITDYVNANRRDIKTDKTGFFLSASTAFKPTTTQEILESRDIVGISKNNFLIDKVLPVLGEIKTPEKITVSQPVSVPVPTPKGGSVIDMIKNNIASNPNWQIIDNINGTSLLKDYKVIGNKVFQKKTNTEIDVNSIMYLLDRFSQTVWSREYSQQQLQESISKKIADGLGINVPDTISYLEIDDFINKSGTLQKENLARLILAGVNVLDNPKSPVYLNTPENATLDKISPLLSLPGDRIVEIAESTFQRSPDLGKLFVSAKPYKTNIQDNSVEQRVQQLIKNCFR